MLWLPGEPTTEGFQAIERFCASEAHGRAVRLLLGDGLSATASGLGQTDRARRSVDRNVRPASRGERWLGGVRPATVELPLRQIGRTVAAMARQLVEGQKVPAETALPCVFSPGETIRPRSARGKGGAL